MANKIETILFDFDGTLFDTNDLIIETFMTVLGKHFPGRYAREDCLPFMGPPLRETFEELAPENVDQMMEEYVKWNLENHDRLTSEFPGVSDVLKKLKERGLKMAIVSTKRNKTIHRGLDLMDAEGVFEVVIGLDDVTHAKPHPEPLQKAMDALGADPATTLMVGDNSHDIEGGRNAGTLTAGVAWSAKGRAFMESLKPDYMLDAIEDLLEIADGKVRAE
ncbi:pyrophosphatase [Bhargavaea cecembensis]|uniref:Pyrophosphatase n=1 Tax=Bhargavaea cecembensis TaxID=394098 RepID=A0A165GHP9_9BACL|nr:pyrophosphatase PpaX [Bhargavaea cecembensis]KZE36429.1 pyrophosphatase [Bhargavaea cecembensis]